MDDDTLIDPIADHLLREHVAVDLMNIRNIARDQGWEDVEELLLQALMKVISATATLSGEAVAVNMH